MNREQMLDYNERLCKEFNDTDNPAILERIAVTEAILLSDPNRPIAPCDQCGGKGYFWVAVDGGAEKEPCDRFDCIVDVPSEQVELGDF